MALWLPGGSAVIRDEHLSVCLDGAQDVRWQGCADVLWSAGPASGRAAAVERAGIARRIRPGALVVCVGYGQGLCVALCAAMPAVVWAARFTPGPGRGLARSAWPAAAAVGSLLHAWAAARLPVDGPVDVLARGLGRVRMTPETYEARGPGGGVSGASGPSVIGAVPASGCPSGARCPSSRTTSGAPTPS
ncbi:hypothetical protein SAMN05216251_106176 [Actinacidiphila alni]|uniref:Uncharacterized protein n=1 Tax=Actinacidiphila alni TaxID=380248 RepID=A0A1I2EE88_9ACTN|nr:hypothetical protein SAMN05216251_106176 [Actinacidiphila alni]